MSIGPAAAQAIAGAPLSQLAASQAERSREAAQGQLRTKAADRAADAAGIADTEDADLQTADRDADGRRLWEAAPSPKNTLDQEAPDPDPPPSKDASGDVGQGVDLSG